MRAALILAVALAALLPAGASPAAETPAWPAGDPRVRLERTVVLDRVAERSRAVRWLTGEERRAGAVARPYGVAWDGEDLLVTDPDAGRVLRLARRGRVQGSPAGALEHPIGVAVCRGFVVVSDASAGKVALLDARLRRVDWLAEDLARPTGVACRGGEIWVVETAAHRLTVFAEDGGRRHLGGRGEAPGRFNFPTSLTLDGGALWVGDALNFRVQRLDPETGAALGGFGRLGDAPGQMPRLKGLAVDAAGHLWVADAHLDRVSLYRADGTFLMDLGRSGSEPGEFLFPAGVAADGRGRVAVVDSFNRRVQIFRLLEAVRSPEEGR